MNPSDDQATDQQIIYLSHFGYQADHPMTRGEAADLLHQYQQTNHNGSAQAGLQVNGSTRQEAHRLRAAVEDAKQALTRATMIEAEVARELLTTASASRQEFWLDTCREAGHMRLSSMEVLELYRTHGCRFCTPSMQQAREVLDALDTALPRWDHEHPELFYQTLELNFPELVRHM